MATTDSELRRSDLGVSRQCDLTVYTVSEDDENHDAKELCSGLPKDLSVLEKESI